MSDETPLTIWIDDNGGEYRFRKFRMDMGPTPIPGWRAWRLLRGEAFDALLTRAVAAEARVEAVLDEAYRVSDRIAVSIQMEAETMTSTVERDKVLLGFYAVNRVSEALRALSRAKAGGAS